MVTIEDDQPGIAQVLCLEDRLGSFLRDGFPGHSLRDGLSIADGAGLVISDEHLAGKPVEGLDGLGDWNAIGIMAIMDAVLDVQRHAGHLRNPYHQ